MFAMPRLRILLAVIIVSLLSAGCTKSKDIENTNTAPSVVEGKPSLIDTTPKPSETPPANPAKDSSYIFAESQEKKLDESALIALKPEMLPFARNEIYARRGYVFTNKIYVDYFSKKSWYKPDPSFSTKSFSDIENYNIDLIKYFEDQYANNQDDISPLLKVYKADTMVSCDLNGDGAEEKIIYRKSRQELIINNKTIKLNLEDLADSFAIVDLDQKDKFKEILISDYGPSDDYSTWYYYFDGTNIVKMGETEGLFDSGINFDGSGRITASTRGHILQTWFFDKNFQLSKEHKLAEVFQELYPTDYDVSLKIPLKLYKNRTDSVPSLLVSKSQVVKIIGTDDKEWCLIKTANGTKGWIGVDDYSTIRNNGLPAWEVFEGLCYAD
jgi:hypothetical protein